MLTVANRLIVAQSVASHPGRGFGLMTCNVRLLVNSMHSRVALRCPGGHAMRHEEVGFKFSARRRRRARATCSRIRLLDVYRYPRARRPAVTISPLLAFRSGRPWNASTGHCPSGRDSTGARFASKRPVRLADKGSTSSRAGCHGHPVLHSPTDIPIGCKQ